MRISLSLLSVSALLLSGCFSTTGDRHRADVYSANQVNRAQEVKTVEITFVSFARVEVDNSEAKKNTQLAGGLLGAVLGGVIGASASDDHQADKAAVGAVLGGAGGAAAGSMVSDKVLVDGVSLTYKYEGKTMNSAQVGRLCEYKPGTAVLLSTKRDETRIQPNSVCPAKN